MRRLAWWMRMVGVFYVLQFVMMAFVRAPIRAQGPEGALAQASAGDPLASFLVDTWVTFGLLSLRGASPGGAAAATVRTR